MTTLTTPGPRAHTAVADRPAFPSLAEHYRAVRAGTVALAEPLEIEDAVVQSMPDVAHQVAPGPHHVVLRDLRAGAPDRLPTAAIRGTSTCSTPTTTRSASSISAAQRGLLTRPPWRRSGVPRARGRGDGPAARRTPTTCRRASPLVEIGTAPRAAASGAHAHRHQARLRTNPLQPAYRAAPVPHERDRRRSAGTTSPGACTQIGHAGDGFAFDNEVPRHRC